LRDELRGHDAEDLALRLMADPTVVAGTAGSEPGESAPELRDLINRMLIDRIKEQETQAIADSTSDPAALSRYRELHNRRLQLELSIHPPTLQG
jgi:DNA primase